MSIIILPMSCGRHGVSAQGEANVLYRLLEKHIIHTCSIASCMKHLVHTESIDVTMLIGGSPCPSGTAYMYGQKLNIIPPWILLISLGSKHYITILPLRVGLRHSFIYKVCMNLTINGYSTLNIVMWAKHTISIRDGHTCNRDVTSIICDSAQVSSHALHKHHIWTV